LATFILKHFSSPEALKKVAPARLIAFLSSHREFLNRRGMSLPSAEAAGSLDLQQLVHIFMTPEDPAARTPSELIDALYVLDEVATPAGMDAILQNAADLGIPLSNTPDQAPMDVAVEAWLIDRDLVLNAHAEQYLDHPRSFEYFPRSLKSKNPYQPPTKHILHTIEQDLDCWFENHRRGRGARVFMFPRGCSTWFLVRHGQPLRREGSMDNGQPSSVVYRPERFDVLVYDHNLDEIRINAQSKGEKDIYREILGKHLRGDAGYFGTAAKYTLDPLRVDKTNSLNCQDIPGIEKITLREVKFFWGGAENEVETRRAVDIFAAYAARNHEFPRLPKIIEARFEVKFTGSKATRMVTVRGHNTQCVRDPDTTLIESWLKARGFAAKLDATGQGADVVPKTLGGDGGHSGAADKLGGLGIPTGSGIFIDLPAPQKDRNAGKRTPASGTPSD
jgi:hypothetical protein